jgi:PAS domain S-box-containing protein
VNTPSADVQIANLTAALKATRDLALRTATALEQQREFLERAQEVAHIGSWVAELDDTDALGWSAETHRIFGVPLGQFKGTSEAFFGFVHEEDREGVRRASEAATASNAPYDVEHRIVRADGTVRWVQEKADVLRDASGRATRMVGTVQDITDRRQLEDQLRQSQKMEAIGRLAGGIAHDLNNALTAIAGYSELALGEVPPGHAARADVEEIRKAAERAGSVTRQLLAFSRKQLLEPRLFNLNDTVVNIARLLTRLLGHDIHVETKLAATLPEVLGDPGQVEQAIINLAVNARDAMPSGGRVTLTTSVDDVDDTFARRHVPMTPGKYVALRVADTGHGMTRETQARVFEPFFTTKEQGRGTGLGLATVYGIVKQSGGFIDVHSELHQGATFRVYLPAMPGARAVPIRRETVRSAKPGSETILVVEDERAVRTMTRLILERAGYHVVEAAAPGEAQEIVRSRASEIDLMISDVVMPGAHGPALFKQLSVGQPSLRVLYMSGYTDDEVIRAGRLEGWENFMEKPFTSQRLLEKVREILDS